MSSDLKFENEDNAGAPVDLEALESRVGIAIEEQQAKGGDGPAPIKGTDAVDEGLSAGLGGVSKFAQAAGLAMALGAETHKGVSSFFPGQQVDARKGGPSSVSPLVPMTYREKKEVARNENRAAAGKRGRDDDLVSRSKVSGMSLTGESPAAGKPKSPQIKGLKISPQALVLAAGVDQSLIDTLTNIRAAKDGPMSDARLQQGLGQGNADAERELHRRKVNNAPQMPTPQYFFNN